MEKLFSSRIQILLQIAGVAVVLLNVWIAGKLVPLAIDIASIKGRVNALENYRDENKPLIERFYQLEQRDKQLVETVNDIDSKVDMIIEQQNQLRNQLQTNK